MEAIYFRKSAQNLCKYAVAVLIAFLAFFTMQDHSFAETYDDFADGEYDITMKALHAKKDENSVANDYINDDASLKVEDGVYTLTLTVPKSEEGEPEFTLYGMQIDEAEETKDEDEDNLYYTFEMDDISDTLDGHTQYEVPDFNLDHDVDFRIQLEGLEEIPTIDENDESEDGNDSGDESDGSEDKSEENGQEEKTIEFTDGFYTLDASYLRTDNDNESAMARYISDEAFVSVTGNQVALTLTINDNDTVKKLTVNDEEADDSVVDEEENIRYETFNLDSIETLMNAYVEYQAGGYNGDADFRISLDDDSVNEVTEEDKPGHKLADEDKSEDENDSGDENEESEDENDSGDEDEESGDETNSGDKNESEESGSSNQPSSDVERLDVIIKALHADKDEPSVAADYINEDAELERMENGQYKLTVTVPKSAEGEPEFELYGMQIDGAEETKEEDSDNYYYIFEMDELHEILNAHTQYKVPDFNLDHDVDFRFQFEDFDRILKDLEVPEEESGNSSASGDESKDNSKNMGNQNKGDSNGAKEKNKNALNIASDKSESGSHNIKGEDQKDLNTAGNQGEKNSNNAEDDDENVSKPAFGSNHDKGDESKDQKETKQTNPKTGDLSGVWSYSILLVLSAIAIGYFIKRRFIL